MKSGESRRERILRKNVQGKPPKCLSILRFFLGIVAGNNPRSRSYDFMDRLLVLLRHKPSFLCLLQQGHRSRLDARWAMRRRLTVAMDVGTWRSGRSGGAAGSVTFGKGSVLALRGALDDDGSGA